MATKRKKKRIDLTKKHYLKTFRDALATDLSEAARMIDDDSSLVDAITYGSDESGETSLHFWAVENRADIISWLLKHGADPNGKSPHNSPLFDASQLGNTKVCQLLLNAGASARFVNNSRETPLHVAARQGYIDVCKALIDAGADVNAEEMCGETPWDEALPRKLNEIRALLEENGANPRS